jgi:hypothetical protein
VVAVVAVPQVMPMFMAEVLVAPVLAVLVAVVVAGISILVLTETVFLVQRIMVLVAAGVLTSDHQLLMVVRADRVLFM